MKHLNNRRNRKVMRYLRLFVRRCHGKDSFVLATLFVALTVALSIGLTANAVCIQSDDSSEYISTKAVLSESLSSQSCDMEQDSEFFRSLEAKIENGIESALVESTTVVTTTVTTQTTTTTQATTTSLAATTTSTEEARNETAEIETVDPEPVAWDEDIEEESYSESEDSSVSDYSESVDSSDYDYSESADGSVYDYVSEYEIVMLAKTVAQEGGDCSYVQQACVIWTVLNRVDSPEWPNSISENLMMPGQFAYYSDKSYRDDHYQVAYDQVYNWLFGGDRYLSSEYQYFYGDGWRNHFHGKNTGEYVPD